MKGSIRQRSPGSWEITLSLGYDAAGRRNRMSITFRGTKTEAQRRLRELLSTVDRGNDIPAFVPPAWAESPIPSAPLTEVRLAARLPEPPAIHDAPVVVEPPSRFVA